jgi:hypothetical protein
MTSLLRVTSYLISYSTYVCTKYCQQSGTHCAFTVSLTTKSRLQHYCRTYISVCVHGLQYNQCHWRPERLCCHAHNVSHTHLHIFYPQSFKSAVNMSAKVGSMYIETVEPLVHTVETVEPLAFKICHCCHPNKITAVIPSLSQSSSKHRHNCHPNIFAAVILTISQLISLHCHSWHSNTGTAVILIYSLLSV